MQLQFWVLVTFLCLTTDGKTIMQKLTFDGCKGENWRVTDISLEPDGDKVNVIADISYNEEPTHKIHQIKVTLVGCGGNYKCTGHENLVVGDVECGKSNNTELDREACDVAKVLAEWAGDTGNKESRETKNSVDENGCIHYDARFFNPELIN